VRANNADLWSGFVLGGLGVFIITQAASWEYLGNDGPGPGFFPLWYGIAIVGLSLVLVVSSLSVKEAIDWRGAGRAFAAWGAFALAAAAMKWLGFLVSFAALTFYIVAVMYRRPLVAAAIVALATAAGFYLVFQLALDVKLPPWTLFRA
jgi:putative tricarboxylic transport membrane protein